MPTPPPSGVSLMCAQRWYESLHATFASRREVPHLPPPFRSGQGGLNSSLMKGLTAQAACHHQMGPNLTTADLLPRTVARTLYTHRLVSIGPVQAALGTSHGCHPSASCPSDRHTFHPCVVTASHLIHTLPPDIHVICLQYQRWLLNPCFFLVLPHPGPATRAALLSPDAQVLDLISLAVVAP